MTPHARALWRDSIVLGACCLLCLAVLVLTFWWPSVALWAGRLTIGGLTAGFGLLTLTARSEARSGSW